MPPQLNRQQLHHLPRRLTEGHQSFANATPLRPKNHVVTGQVFDHRRGLFREESHELLLKRASHLTMQCYKRLLGSQLLAKNVCLEMDPVHISVAPQRLGDVEIGLRRLLLPRLPVLGPETRSKLAKECRKLGTRRHVIREIRKNWSLE